MNKPFHNKMASTFESMREKFGLRLLTETPPKILLDLIEEGLRDLSKNGPNMGLRKLAVQALKDNIIGRVRTDIEDNINKAFVFKDEKFKNKFRCQDKDKSCKWYSDWTSTYLACFPKEDSITLPEVQLIHLLDCLYDVLCKAAPFFTFTYILKDLLASLASINPMIPAAISKKWNFKRIDMQWKLEVAEETQATAESAPDKIEPKDIPETTPAESTPANIVPKSTELEPFLLSGKVPVAVLFTTLDKALNNIVQTSNDAKLKKFATVVLELNNFSKYCDDMEKIIEDVRTHEDHPHSITIEALSLDKDGNSKWYGKRRVHADVNNIDSKDVIVELLYKLLNRFDDVDTKGEFLYDDYELLNKGKYDILSSSYCILQMRKNIWESIRQAGTIFNEAQKAIAKFETKKAPQTVRAFSISLINGRFEKVPVIITVDDWNNMPFAK